jgi:hypothetical protein
MPGFLNVLRDLRGSILELNNGKTFQAIPRYASIAA